MNIANLKAFTETVQTSSISKAAEILHLTQPAVSLQIQSLENSIGYQLLIRSNRGVQLTDYGKIFYSYAQSFLTLWDNLQRDLNTMAEGEPITLQVGACPAIGQYALPCALYLLKQKFPHLKVSYLSLTSDQVLDELREHTLQVGFLEGNPKAPNIASLEVLSAELVLVTSAGHDCRPLKLAEVLELPLVLSLDTCDIRRSLKKNLEQNGVEPGLLKPLLELDNIEGVKSAVIGGHGYTFLPYFTIKKELFTGELQKVIIEDATLEIKFAMIWRKDEEMMANCKLFIDFIKTQGIKSFC